MPPDLSLLQLLAVSVCLPTAVAIVLAGWADQDRMGE